MKKVVTLIVVAFLASISAMIGIHWFEMRAVQAKIGKMQNFAERRDVASGLILELERYRRQSGSFRKMGEAEEAVVKSRLKNEMNNGLALLRKLDPTPEELKLSDKVADQITELELLTTQIEPQLFTRDVFQKPEPRAVHEAMVSSLLRIKESAQNRVESMRAGISSASRRSMDLLILSALIAVSVLIINLIRSYFSLHRPILRLKGRVLEIRAGKLLAEGAKGIRGVMGEIEEVVNHMASTIHHHRNERQEFIRAISQDLRNPLMNLQAGAEAFMSFSQPGAGGANDEVVASSRKQALEVMRRSLFRVSKTLEDLTDLVEIERGSIRLDEKVIDLGVLLSDLCRNMGGAGSSHDIQLKLPQSSIWVMVDPGRMERVFIHLISKLMVQLPQGGRIDIALHRSNEGKFRGVEVLVQDGERLGDGKLVAAGPEQDLLKHWVSENGFGMTLADRVLRSHGGSVSASGVAGTGVVFIVRIPSERVAQGLIGASSEAVRVNGLETTRIKAMFPAAQTVKLGS